MTADHSHAGASADPPRVSFPGRLDVRVPATAGNLPPLRQRVRRFATIVGVPDPDDVALAATEAVTNAILHAYRDGEPGELRLVACDEPDRLVVVVRDYGCGMSPRSDSPGLGMGLSIIGTLASSTNIERPDDGGTRVRMHFDKP